VDSFERPPLIDVRDKYGIPPETKLLLFVGRLAKEKNVSFLLRVLRELLNKNYDVQLMFVGDGPERSQLEEEARGLEIEDRVIFAGALPREQLVDYYQQADLFVFASVTETQGLVVLESLAAGTPVVAVAKMGVANVLKDGKGALLLQEPKLEEFVEKVEMLLSDSRLYDDMRSAGKAYVRQHWSIERTVQDLGKVYELSLLEGPAEVEYYTNVWIEIIVERMKQISSKIFTSGGGRRVTFAPFSRTRGR